MLPSAIDTTIDMARFARNFAVIDCTAWWATWNDKNRTAQQNTVHTMHHTDSVLLSKLSKLRNNQGSF